jgi:hypothetical protein
MFAVAAGAASSGPELTTTPPRATWDGGYRGPYPAILNWTRQVWRRCGAWPVWLADKRKWKHRVWTDWDSGMLVIVVAGK